VDERLLEDEQLTFLCQTHNNGYRSVCRIFTMREWLEEIYSGRKEPSRNEFNEDYTEYLRIQKKEGKITAEEEERFNQDISEKLHFEIQNFFLSNMRAVNGQLSTFVPFLYKDIFYSAMDKLWLSKQTIADCIDQYRTIDYTVFLHDVMFSAPESGVEREYILKEIAPDLIILPVYGQNSSMWQEIEGRKRDSHARILFPTFSEGPLDDMVIKAFGRYRWELCRCVQGMAWNNIQEKSLTSEYVDYIQFYRKNRDLTDEKREKIKLQIQKAKNNSREIFVLDYEAWMKSEANGALKLNKIAREIIATYCPFNAETRERLERNPAFADACARQKRDAGKRAKTLDLKVRQIESNGCEVPQEMIQTLKYLTEY
jgi:hypothetical protein